MAEKFINPHTDFDRDIVNAIRTAEKKKYAEGRAEGRAEGEKEAKEKSKRKNSLQSSGSWSAYRNYHAGIGLVRRRDKEYQIRHHRHKVRKFRADHNFIMLVC